jgi:hypothetical protein
MTTDLNGDNKTTTQDAELVVILSGGDHGAHWVKSTGSSAAVMNTAGSSKSSSSTRTVGASAGASFGGIEVEVSGEVSRTEAEEATSSVGSGATAGSSESIEFNLHTPEGATDCRYILRWYEYWRVRKWVRHTPGEDEIPGLQQAYDSRSGKEDEWGYFQIEGSPSIAVGRTLYGGNHVAVRKTEAGWEYYVLGSEKLVRVPKGLHILNCNVGSPSDGASRSGDPNAARFFGGGSGMGGATFDGSTTIRYLGWGVLPDTRPELYTNMECGNEISRELTINSELQTTEEGSTTRTTTRGSSVTESAKLEIPVVDAKVTGGASATQSQESARSKSTSWSKSFTNQVSTTVRWDINDPHKPLLVHYSDHELYMLHLLLEARNWHGVSDSAVPKSVRDAAGTGSGRTFVGTSGGGMVMRNGDGGFMVSGPPVIMQKQIGFMLVRIAQRPCPYTYTPTTTPDESGGPDNTNSGPEGGKVTPTPGHGAGTPQTPDQPNKPGNPPEQGSYRAPSNSGGSKVYMPRGNMDNYTAVTFTALGGETVIDRRAIGDVQSVTFVAVDGRRMADKELSARVTTGQNTVRLNASDVAGVARILIGGTAGSVELVGATTPSPSRPVSGLVIQDGTIDVMNGNLHETVQVPNAMTGPAATPDQYRVTINNQPVQPVAVHQGEIAVTGQNVPQPTGGSSAVSVTGPSGATASGQAPSWGYDVQVQPVMHAGQTVPVMLQLFGIGASERVLVEFVPGAGQSINPGQLTLSGAQASAMQPVASLTAQIPGIQKISVRVTRIGGQTRSGP